MRFRAKLFHVAIITWKLLLPFRELSKTRREKSNNNKIVTSTVSRDSSRIFRYKSEKGRGMMMMMMTRVRLKRLPNSVG